MAEPSSSIHVENVVASSSLAQELDLDSVAADLPGAEYDPDQFPGLMNRRQDPNATALVYRSGKVVTTGTRSLAEVEAVLSQLFAELAELGIEVPDEINYTVQNMVISANIGHQLNLSALAIGLGLEAAEYEPEQFPGLVYRLTDPEVVVLLFASGRLVITGATQQDEAIRAFDTVRSDLDELDLLD